MIQRVSLTPDSRHLEAELVDGLRVDGGLVFALDCATSPPADPWETWVAQPTEQILVRVCGDLQAARQLPPMAAVVRTVSPDSPPTRVADATRVAAVEAIRGTLDAIGAELAPDSVRSNLIVIDDQTTMSDARRSLEYLLDERAAGFTTGTTLWMGGGSTSTRRLPTGNERQARTTPPRALVTGATGGIGFAAAEALTQAGYMVFAADLPSPRLEEAARQIGAVPIPFDVTDLSQIQAAAESDLLRDGLQVLALHHGIDGSGALRALDVVRIRRIMAINGTAVARLIETFLPALRRGAPSAVVAVSSQAGIKAEPFNAAYCAAKFGVAGLVHGLAPVLAGDGVSIHVLCPGCTDTPLLSAAFEGFARGSGQTADFYRRQRTEKIPMQRLGSPAEMGAATVYLAQLEATTGLVLAPTGAETLT